MGKGIGGGLMLRCLAVDQSTVTVVCKKLKKMRHDVNPEGIRPEGTKRACAPNVELRIQLVAQKKAKPGSAPQQKQIGIVMRMRSWMWTQPIKKPKKKIV